MLINTIFSFLKDHSIVFHNGYIVYISKYVCFLYILFIMLMLLICCMLQPIGWWGSEHFDLYPPKAYSPMCSQQTKQ